MKTKQVAVLRRVSLGVVILVAWVGVALLLSFGVWPSRRLSVTQPIAMAPSPSEAPFPPSFIFTQFVAGGPLTVATQAPNGSLVVVTQYPVQSLTLFGPDRYLAVDPDGTEREVSLSEFQRRVRSDVRSLGLFDFRYQPDIKLDDLK